MLLSRFVPVTVKTPLKRSFYAAQYYLTRPDPRFPPPWLHDVGATVPRAPQVIANEIQYISEGVCKYLQRTVGLKATDRVLDVGSGTGRIAWRLVPLLTNGFYVGFDIVPASIAWCQRAYGDISNARFHHADIYNPLYNPNGRLAATEYAFPVPDCSMDLVLLFSVFTHMRPAELQHYLSETARVLAPGGRSVATYHVFDPAWIHKTTFQVHGEGYRANDAAVHENGIAYDEADVRAWHRQCDLTIREPIEYGSWSRQRAKTAGGVQDVVIAVRP